jgi:hypothetical protein
MPGRNLADFRSGNWNEELGILLLKKIAAVAPVPRQEDFGLDAVATLLRMDPMGDFLYAEDSFYIQFKSASTNEIEYKVHEITWLKALQLPYFVGIVDNKAYRLDLFPGHELGDVFIALKDFKKVTVRTGPRGKKNWKHDDQSVEIYLGSPLLSFTIGDISDPKFAQEAYYLLKDFLRYEQQNVVSRQARFISRLEWRTNQDVKMVGRGSTISRAQQKEELHQACESMVPALHLAEMYAKATDDRELQRAIDTLTHQLKKVFAEREYVDEEKTAYVDWTDPFRAGD